MKVSATRPVVRIISSTAEDWRVNFGKLTPAPYTAAGRTFKAENSPMKTTGSPSTLLEEWKGRYDGAYEGWREDGNDGPSCSSTGLVWMGM